MAVKKKIIIKGPKVVDVGYRFFLYEEAARRGIPNFDARNIENKAKFLEVLVGGNRKIIEEFVSYAKANYPPKAVVEEVAEEGYEGPIMSMESFERFFVLYQWVKMTRIWADLAGEAGGV